MGGILGGLQDFFSGSQNKNQVEDSTQHQASTGTTSAEGATTEATAGANNYNLGDWSNWALGQLPIAYNWAQGATQGAAAPTNWGQIQPLLTPFAGQQIQANLEATAPAEAQQRSYRLGQEASNPFASTSGGRGSADQLFEASLAAQHQQMAAGVNNNSYTQALQAAQADAARRLQAGQASGALTTQNLNVGQYIPYGGQTTAGTTAGTTAQQEASSGAVDSTGHNVADTTTKNTPSAASTLGTVAGIGADVLPFLMMSDERAKDNIKEIGKTHDGQLIYKFNYLGSPMTQMGLLAQDVEQKHPHAVSHLGHVDGLKMVDVDAATKRAERKDGGSTFHGKVEDAFHAFHRMRQHAQNGGKAQPPKYDDGGGVPFGDWNSPSPTGSEDGMTPNGASVGDPNGWGATVDRTPDTSMTLGRRAQGILGAIGKMGMQSQSGNAGTSPPSGTTNTSAASGDGRSFAAALAALRNPALEALQSRTPQAAYTGGRVGYADGGVGDWFGSLVKNLTPNSPFAPPDSPASDILRKEYGVDPRAMYSPSRNLVSDLASIDPMVPGHSGPLTGISARMAQENATAFKGADLLGQRTRDMGVSPTGQQTLAGQAAPGEREATQARTVTGQKAIEEYKLKTTRELGAQEQLRKTLADIDTQERWETITPEQATRARQQAQDLYIKSRGDIQDVTSPAERPAAPPSGARLKWSPGAGAQ